MNIDEKLRNLEAATIKQAEVECEKINAEYESKKQQIISQKELELLSVFYNSIQKEKHRISKEKNNSILNKSAENKQRLNLKRELLIDEIFAGVNKEISSFVKTEDYKDYMIKIINEAKYIFRDEKIKITLNKTDTRFEEMLKKENSDIVSIEYCMEDILGGMIIEGLDSVRIYDHSLKSAISYERKNFSMFNTI